jgi:hypothetical protein
VGRWDVEAFYGQCTITIEVHVDISFSGIVVNSYAVHNAQQIMRRLVETLRAEIGAELAYTGHEPMRCW